MSDGLFELSRRINLLRSDVDRLKGRQPDYSPRPIQKQIAVGVIEADHHSHFLLQPESGATDDLVTINGGADGRRIVLMVEDASETITVKNGTGNILLQADRPLSNQKHTLSLLFVGHLNKWVELAYSVGGSGSGSDADTLDGIDSTGFALAAHVHAGEDITTGTVADARIASTITRDSEVFTIVLASDGPGSGLNADLLDGFDSGAFAAAIHAHAGEDITSGTVADARIASTITRDSEVMTIVLAADGAGSGLDADLLDGLSSAAFFLLAGRAGGQTGKGGLNSGDDLTLDSTDHATKGTIFLQPSGGNVNVGSVGEVSRLNVGGGLYLNSAELDFNAIRIRPLDGLGISRIQAVGDNAISHTELVFKQLAPAGAGNPTDSSIEFRTMDGGTLATKMWLLDSGFLGIGVSPSSALDIRLSSVNAVVENIVNLQSDSSLSLYAAGTTAFGITPWIDAAVIESGSTTSGGLVLSAYVGNLIFQTGARTTQMVISDGGYLYFADDTDRYAFIGRAAVGGTSQYSDYAYFGHRDLAGAPGNYAVLQSSLGDTFFNAASGRTVYLRINNNAVGTWNSTTVDFSYVASTYVTNLLTTSNIYVGNGDVAKYIYGGTVGNGWKLNAYQNLRVGYGANGAIGINADPGTLLTLYSHWPSANAAWSARIDNHSGTGADVYMAHGSGYGMHVRGYNASDSIYTLQLYNNTVPLAEFYNSGRQLLGMAGNVGFGSVTSPQGKVHGHDGTGGFLFATKTTIDGTAQVIIPNGAGDVTKRLFATYTGGSSGGAVFSGSTGLSVPGDVEIYNDGTNAHILKLRINADGSVDIRRTAGANTYTASVWLIWQ